MLIVWIQGLSFSHDEQFFHIAWCTYCSNNIYYCTTGRAIRGNIQLKGGIIGPTEGRDNTEPESWIFPHIARPRVAQ